MLQSLIERFRQVKGHNTYEGSRGIENLEALVKVLGYKDLDAFFEDNSGALDAIVEWIGSESIPEWRRRLEDIVGSEDDEDFDDEEDDDDNWEDDDEFDDE